MAGLGVDGGAPDRRLDIGGRLTPVRAGSLGWAAPAPLGEIPP